MLVLGLIITSLLLNIAPSSSLEEKGCTSSPSEGKKCPMLDDDEIDLSKDELELLLRQFGNESWTPTDIDLSDAFGTNHSTAIEYSSYVTHFLRDSRNKSMKPHHGRTSRNRSRMTRRDNTNNKEARAYKYILKKYLERSLLAEHKRSSKKEVAIDQLLRGVLKGNPTKMLCTLKRMIPQALTRSYKAFRGSSLAAQAFPQKPAIEWSEHPSKTCAVVSNSGRLLATKMGHEIDTYEQIVRLNGAPTNGYENYVGKRTTVRLINDVLASCLHMPNCPHSEDFSDSRKALLLAWDICRPRASFYKCMKNLNSNEIAKNTGSDSIGGFIKWKAKHKDRAAYFLDPDWLYRLNDFLRSLTPALVSNSAVPSTGFLAYVLMAHHCKKVHLFHMMPTMGPPQPCKYYVQTEKLANSVSCSVIPQHPRELELAMFMRLNEASDTETYKNGRMVLPGFAGLKC